MKIILLPLLLTVTLFFSGCVPEVTVKDDNFLEKRLQVGQGNYKEIEVMSCQALPGRKESFYICAGKYLEGRTCVNVVFLSAKKFKCDVAPKPKDWGNVTSYSLYENIQEEHPKAGEVNALDTKIIFVDFEP